MFSVKNLLLVALASSPALVNGVYVSLQRYSDASCSSEISNEQLNSDSCLVVSGGVSSSYKLNTNGGSGTDWAACGDGQTFVLKTWQSSSSCSGAPDSSIGPIGQDSQEGSCGLTPIASVQLICV